MKVRVGSIEMLRRMYNGVMKGTYVGRGHPYLLQQLLQLHLKICTARRCTIRLYIVPRAPNSRRELRVGRELRIEEVLQRSALAVEGVVGGHRNHHRSMSEQW